MVINLLSVLKTSGGYLIYLLILAVVIMTFWGINPDLVSLETDNSLLPFFIIFVLSFVGGEIVSLLKLPKIVGMIISGFALSNAADGIIIFNPVYSDVIRNIALTVLLVQAGIELDLTIIKKMSTIVLRLCFVPMIAEIVITGLTGHFILGLPVVWSVMLGLILSAACAAIVVPIMIDLKRKGLGVDQGISTIVTAACSLDDVFAIAGFGITLGFAFPSSADASLTRKILKAPSEVIIGIVIGISYGYVVSSFPDPEPDLILGADKDIETDLELRDKISRSNLIRLICLIFGGFALIFSSTQLDFSGSGPLGVLVFGAVAGHRFRGYSHINQDLAKRLDCLWSLLAIFLFSLIGADVKITNIDGNIVLSILAVLLIGIAFRILATFSCLFSGGLNFKEKSFISIAWVSKAAVQAAVGPVALTIARSRCTLDDCDQDDDVVWAKVILTTSVFAVLICAPLGALGMSFTAEKFLRKSQLSISTCPAIEAAANTDKMRHVAITLIDGTQLNSEKRRSV